MIFRNEEEQRGYDNYNRSGSGRFAGGSDYERGWKEHEQEDRREREAEREQRARQEEEELQEYHRQEEQQRWEEAMETEQKEQES